MVPVSYTHLDVYKRQIEDRIYNNSDYDYNIVIEDRIRQVAREITAYLKSTDRLAKTCLLYTSPGRSAHTRCARKWRCRATRLRKTTA